MDRMKAALGGGGGWRLKELSYVKLSCCWLGIACHNGISGHMVTNKLSGGGNPLMKIIDKFRFKRVTLVIRKQDIAGQSPPEHMWNLGVEACLELP